MGLSQLSKLEEFIKLKKDLHRQYSNNINDKYLKSFNEYETPWFIDLYCNSQNQREELHLYLKQKNIETRFSYPSLSSQSYLQNIEKTDLTFSEEISTIFTSCIIYYYQEKMLNMFLVQLITFLKIKTIFIK